MAETSAFIAIVMGLAQMLKQINVVPKRFIPLVNIGVGVAICIMFADSSLKMAIFQGITVGLSACGLFSSGKNIAQGIADAQPHLEEGNP